MKFTNTDCISYDIYWDYDAPIYDQLHEEVDDYVRWDLIEQVESQVSRKVYINHNPIRYKIKQEVKK